jgi:hypothetical protein
LKDTAGADRASSIDVLREIDLAGALPCKHAVTTPPALRARERVLLWAYTRKRPSRLLNSAPPRFRPLQSERRTAAADAWRDRSSPATEQLGLQAARPRLNFRRTFSLFFGGALFWSPNNMGCSFVYRQSVGAGLVEAPARGAPRGKLLPRGLQRARGGVRRARQKGGTI